MLEYDCPQCDYSSRGRSSIDLHRRVEHSEQADPDVTILTCPYCDGDYYAYSASADGRKFCSKQCSNASRNDKRGNPPKREYGENWHERADAARFRDGDRCADCGSSMDYGHKMDVHHVVECGFFDDDDKRNDLRNLVTLCDSCHGNWEGMTDEEQLNALRDVIMNQAVDRLKWVREQQERLKGGE